MKKLLFIIFLFVTSFNAFSQPPGDPCESEDPDAVPCDPASIPIDGGVIFLVGSGAALALGGLYKFQKQQAQIV